jgi:hypothetical protein
MKFRRTAPLITTIALAALVGCGGSSSSSSSGSQPSGEASKSASAILGDAAAALGKVHSFHLQGAETEKGGPVAITGDVALPGRVRLNLRQGAGAVDVVIVGKDAFIKANSEFWKSQAGAAAVAGLLADKWVKAPPSATAEFGQFLAVTDPATIGHCLVASHHGTISKAGTDTVAGTPVVVLEDKGDAPGSSPGKLYVAASGPPLPLRVVETGPKKPGGKPDPQCKETSVRSTTTASDLRLSDYDKTVTIEAPKGAMDLSKLAGGGASGA